MIPSSINKEYLINKYKIENLVLIGDGTYKKAYSRNDGKVILLYKEIAYDHSFQNEIIALRELKRINIPIIEYIDYDIIKINNGEWVIALAEKYEKLCENDLEIAKKATKNWARKIFKNNLYFYDLQIMKKNGKFFAHDPSSVDSFHGGNVIVFSFQNDTDIYDICHYVRCL